MAEEQWYYSTQGRQAGPVTREVLRRLIVTGQVRENDMVWTAGMSQWTTAQLVPQLMTAPTPRQQGLIGAETLYRVEFAAFWRRWLAWVIDTMVLAVLSIIAAVTVVVAMAGYRSTLDAPMLVRRPTLTMELSLAVAVFSVYWLYSALMESSSYQATLGKLVLGIYVTDQEGLGISFPQASVRCVAKLVSYALLMVGFLMAGWTVRNQALHDLVAGTLVVRKR